jgi:AraC family transcriptional regulator
MAERLEMVVGGQRRVAMPDAPLLTSSFSMFSGFFIEEAPVFTGEMPDHWIPNYMVGLQLVPGGAKRFFLEDGRMRKDEIHNGSCVVLGPREIRRFRLEAEGSVFLVAIDPVVMQEITADAPASHGTELVGVNNANDALMQGLLLQLRENVAAGCPNGPPLGESLCMKVAETVIQEYSLRRLHLDEYRGGLSGARLRLALEYIEEYLSLELKTGNIAGAAGLSKYHFGKAFKQSMGMTLHRYVLSRRIRRAQGLLRKTNLPLAAVAAAAGFSNQSHLTTLFSVRTGVSPNLYRQNARRISVART